MKDSLEARFIKALHLQKSGYHQMALEAYEAILREKADHVGCLINLGILRYLKSQFVEARECFDRALHVDPKNANALYNFGKLLMEEQKPTEAADYLERALEVVPEDLMTIRELAACYFQLGRRTALDALLDRGLELAAGNPELLAMRARSHLEAGEAEEATQVLIGALRHQPSNLKLLMLLADSYQHARNFEKAIVTVKRALLINPKLAEGYQKLGVYYLLKGEDEKAQQEFERATALDPSLVTRIPGAGAGIARDNWDGIRFQSYVLERARYYASSEDTEGAIKEFERLMHRHPNQPIVWQELAAAYQVAGDLKRARSLYQKVLESDPQNLEVRLQSARICLDLGQTADASKINSVTMTYYPDVPDVYEIHGEILLLCGDHASARQHFDRALVLDPKNIEALLGLGRCLEKAGDIEGARKIWEKSYLMAPANTELSLALVDTNLNLGRVERAVRILTELKEAQPDNLVVRSRLVDTFLRSRRFAKARQELGELTEATERSLEDIPHLLMGWVHARRVRDAQRLIRKYQASRRDEPLLLFFEILIHCFKRDPMRFHIPWQKIVQGSPGLLMEKADYLRLVLTPEDVIFLTTEIRNSAPLFAHSPETTERLKAFLAKLESFSIPEESEPRMLFSRPS